MILSSILLNLSKSQGEKERNQFIIGRSSEQIFANWAKRELQTAVVGRDFPVKGKIYSKSTNNAIE